MKKQTQEVSSSEEQKAGDTRTLLENIYKENGKKHIVSRQGGSRWNLDKEKLTEIREIIKKKGKPLDISPQQFCDMFGIDLKTITRKTTDGKEGLKYYAIWKKMEALGFKDLHCYTCWIDGERGIQIRIV